MSSVSQVDNPLSFSGQLLSNGGKNEQMCQIRPFRRRDACDRHWGLQKEGESGNPSGESEGKCTILHRIRSIIPSGASAIVPGKEGVSGGGLRLNPNQPVRLQRDEPD